MFGREAPSDGPEAADDSPSFQEAVVADASSLGPKARRLHSRGSVGSAPDDQIQQLEALLAEGLLTQVLSKPLTSSLALFFCFNF